MKAKCTYIDTMKGSESCQYTISRLYEVISFDADGVTTLDDSGDVNFLYTGEFEIVDTHECFRFQLTEEEYLEYLYLKDKLKGEKR